MATLYIAKLLLLTIQTKLTLTVTLTLTDTVMQKSQTKLTLTVTLTLTDRVTVIFFYAHFVDGNWTLRLRDTSPTFAYKTLGLLDSSPIGQFAN